MIFEYSVQRTFDEMIDIVDIGNTALRCTNSEMCDYYIILKTIMGEVEYRRVMYEMEENGIKKQCIC